MPYAFSFVLGYQLYLSKLEKREYLLFLKKEVLFGLILPSGRQEVEECRELSALT